MEITIHVKYLKRNRKTQEKNETNFIHHSKKRLKILNQQKLNYQK